MSNTLGEIVDETYFLMWEDNSSTTYPFSRVVDKINTIISMVCSGEFKDIIRSTSANNVIYKAGDLRFLRSKLFLEKKPWSPTTWQVNIWDASISIDTSNFSASWYAMLWGNIFQYTWITPTTLTWVTWVIGNFVEWTLVEQVFIIPSDADRSFRVTNILPKNIGLWFPNQDNKFDVSANAYFSIIPDTNSTDNNFIYIPWTYTNPSFWFEYYKKPNELVATNDVTILPWNYGKEVIAPLCAWELLYESEETTDWVAKLQLGYSKLALFYSKYKDFNKQFRDQVEWKRQNNYYFTTSTGNWW